MEAPFRMQNSMRASVLYILLLTLLMRAYL